MLVCKVYETESGCLVAGSCFIKGYEQGGWFPINSFGFGFEHKDKGGKAGANKTAQGGGGNANARPRVALSGQGNQSGASESETEESKVSINKFVDTGTCDLMALAMRDRKKKKGRESKVKADIHLLSIVEVRGGDRFTFPNLMIHLEGVLVRNWKLDASGDERGEESLDLQYDRVAMNYTSTGDGKIFAFCAPRGWDQTEDKEFTWGNNWDKYLEKLK
jgi:hypothetical protein